MAGRWIGKGGKGKDREGRGFGEGVAAAEKLGGVGAKSSPGAQEKDKESTSRSFFPNRKRRPSKLGGVDIGKGGGGGGGGLSSSPTTSSVGSSGGGGVGEKNATSPRGSPSPASVMTGSPQEMRSQRRSRAASPGQRRGRAEESEERGAGDEGEGGRMRMSVVLEGLDLPSNSNAARRPASPLSRTASKKSLDLVLDVGNGSEKTSEDWGKGRLHGEGKRSSARPGGGRGEEGDRGEGRAAEDRGFGLVKDSRGRVITTTKKKSAFARERSNRWQRDLLALEVIEGGAVGFMDLIEDEMADMNYQEFSSSLYQWGKDGIREFPFAIEIVSLSAQGHHACALSRGGEVYTWGQQKKDSPVLGLGPSISSVSEPTRVPSLQGVPIVYIGCGLVTTAAIDDRGLLYLWGDTLQSTNRVSPYPTVAEQLSTHKILQIALSHRHGLALIQSGSTHEDTQVWAWGFAEKGMLGHPNFSNLNEPQDACNIHELDDENVVYISASDTHCACCTTRGEIWSWGSNTRIASNNTKVGPLLGTASVDEVSGYSSRI